MLNGVDAKKAIAGPAAQALVAAGFSNATGHNAAANAAKTAVYFVPGYQTDATLVAIALHFPPTTVQPLASPSPPDVGNPQDANVVVLVGADSAPPNG